MRHITLRCVPTCFVLLAAAIGAAEPDGFANVTTQSGVAAVVEGHYRRVEKWWLSGMTLVDFDGDGDLDLHLAGHGYPAAAAINDGKGHFTSVDPKLKIPRGKRKRNDLPYPGGEIRLAFDLNEDARPDVLCSWHDGGGVTYLNDCAPGRSGKWNFRVQAPGFDAFSRAAAFADINRDGRVDYLATGDGKDGTLTVVLGAAGGKWTKAAGVPVLPESGAIPVDIDGDGDLDLLLSRRGYNPVGRRILVNGGKMNFTDATVVAGLTADGGSIHGVGDVDQDGDADLICIEGKAVVTYLNDGKGRFVRGPVVAGLGSVRAKPKTGNWGGAVVTDFDNDGLADVIVNGKYFLYVLRGLGRGRLELANPRWRLPSAIAPAVDEGLCFGDIDGDGDLDLVTFGRPPAGRKRGVAVYRNDLPGRNWLRVRAIGRNGNAAATGATIRIHRPAGDGEARELLWCEQVAVWGRQSFHSYYTAARTERHFGLGEIDIVDVSVEFYPSGESAVRKGVRANCTVEVRQPPPASKETR